MSGDILRSSEQRGVLVGLLWARPHLAEGHFMDLLGLWVGHSMRVFPTEEDRKAIFFLLHAVGEEAAAETLRDLRFFPAPSDDWPT
jgi:hypothetical protein